MRNFFIFLLLMLFVKSWSQNYIDYTKEKITQLVVTELSIYHNIDSVSIDSVKKLCPAKIGNYEASFCDHFQYYWLFTSCPDSIKREFVVAINSAFTLYRLYGFYMNDIMCLCADIKKDIAYYYGKKHVYLNRELKKMFLSTFRSDGSWFSFELYDLYRGMKKTSYDYKKYPLLDPGKERAIGYFIQRCDSKGKCYIQQK